MLGQGKKVFGYHITNLHSSHFLHNQSPQLYNEFTFLAAMAKGRESKAGRAASKKSGSGANDTPLQDVKPTAISVAIEHDRAPKQKPLKKKRKYSGMQAPEPPLPLLDLIHNFLEDFKYIKAAHGLRTDNQKRPGHNMSLWKSTSSDMPDLIEIFLQWQAQSHANTALAGTSVSKNEDSSEDDMSVDGGDKPIIGVVPTTTSTSLKRKASELSDSSSESSDSDSDSGSSATSSSEDSDSESASDGPATNKKRKFGEAPKTVLGTPRDKGLATDDSDTSETSSDSDSDSDTSSDSDSEGGDNVMASIGLIGYKSDSESASSEDSDSEDSSSSDSSDSEDSSQVAEDVPAPAAIANPERHGSDSSATLPLPESDDDDDDDSDDSESSSSSDSEFESAAETVDKVKSDVLVYEEPLSKKAIERGEQPKQQTMPATPDNAKKLKKEHIPFSRIPADIKVDERFSSNKYVPYDYANRAHQDLIVTKGKGFTKEKNKKKRGSYRGGMIDTSGGKGIKFDD